MVLRLFSFIASVKLTTPKPPSLIGMKIPFLGVDLVILNILISCNPR